MKYKFDYTELIKLFRSKGLHEYQVAFYLNMSPRTFRDKLRSISYFTQGNIVKLVEMLDIPVSDIDALFFNVISSENRDKSKKGGRVWI